MKKPNIIIAKKKVLFDENLFDKISSECIQNIISYSNKSEINSLKMVSRKMAIHCITEMRKVPIDVINGKVTINQANISPTHLFEFSNKLRYDPKKTLRSLKRDWSIKFNIPLNRCLIFIGDDLWDRSLDNNDICYVLQNNNSLSTTIDKFNEYHKSNWKRPSRSYLVLDKKDIVIFQNDKWSKLEQTNYNNQELQRFRLLPLQYFDIKTQEIIIVRYILHENITKKHIIKYLTTDFQCNDNDDGWYQEYRKMIVQMGEYRNYDKIELYWCHYQDLVPLDDDDRNKLNQTPLTFQINDKHPSFDMLKNTFSDSEIFSADTFTHGISKESITIKTNKKLLCESIQRYYDMRLKSIDKEIFKQDIKSILDLANQQEFRFTVSEISGTDRKRKIAGYLGNIIDPKYFEVLDTECYIVWNYPSNKDIIFPQSFSNMREDYALYTIKIYKPCDCPYPVQFKDSETREITIWYHKKFKIQKFIDDIFDIIRKSPEHILMDDGFKELLDLYYDVDDKNEDVDMKEDIADIGNNRSQKIQCLLSLPLNLQYCREKTFENWEYFNIDSKKNVSWLMQPEGFYRNRWRTSDDFDEPLSFNLYMIQTKPMDDTRNIKMSIKFMESSYFNADRVGVPLIIWINQNDTLQYVLNKYVKKSKRFIWHCYCESEVGDTSTVQVIPKKKWNTYKLDKHFDWNKDQLLIKMKFLNRDDMPHASYPIFTEPEIFQQFEEINDIEVEIEENEMEMPELYESEQNGSPTPPPSEYFHRPRPLSLSPSSDSDSSW